MKFVERVRDKLNQFGLQIFDDYPIEDPEHMFYVENMILFVNTKKPEIGLSFQATTKPEKAANITLILHQLGCKIDVMESFIYDENRNCLTGDEAFELIKKSDQMKAIKEGMKQQTMIDILMSSEHGYEC